MTRIVAMIIFALGSQRKAEGADSRGTLSTGVKHFGQIWGTMDYRIMTQTLAPHGLGEIPRFPSKSRPGGRENARCLPITFSSPSKGPLLAALGGRA